MALPANALTTVANCKLFLKDAGSSEDAMLERLIGVASGAIQKYCNRKFIRTEYTLKTDAPEGCRLMVPETPVIEAEEIAATLGGSAISGITVEDAELGFLWRSAGWGASLSPDSVLGLDSIPGTGKRELVVTYTAGWFVPSQTGGAGPGTSYVAGADDSLPLDLEQCVIDTVVSLYRQRGADKTSPAFDTENTAIGRGVYGIIPNKVFPILKSYARGY